MMAEGMAAGILRRWNPWWSESEPLVQEVRGGRLAVQLQPGVGAPPTQLRCSAEQLQLANGDSTIYGQDGSGGSVSPVTHLRWWLDGSHPSRNRSLTTRTARSLHDGYVVAAAGGRSAPNDSAPQLGLCAHGVPPG